MASPQSSSMATLLLTPLSEMTTHLDTLITSITHTNTFASAPAAGTSLVAADDVLTSALSTLKQHQENYARILRLREEAARLEGELKEIVRKVVRLREAVGHVHPSILEDDEEEESDEDENSLLSTATGKGALVTVGKEGKGEVDLQTLLNFASRIGTHNAQATREAARDAERRKINSLKSKPPPDPENPSENKEGEEGEEEGPERDIISAEALNLDQITAQHWTYRAIPFPDAMLLRQGALGRLQKIREDAVDTARGRMVGDIGAGEEAVEREVERLVRGSEVVREKEEENKKKEGSGGAEVVEDGDGEREVASAVRVRRESGSGTQRPQQQRPQQPQQQQTVRRKKLNLDLGGDDDDDDSD